MKKLDLYIRRDYFGKDRHERWHVDATYQMESDGSFRGKILNQSAERLFELLGPSEQGDLFAILKARRYKITELTCEGDFTAVPDFQIANVVAIARTPDV